MSEINTIKKNERKKQADQRNIQWKKKTPKEQLNTLDERLGKNIGAKKQREKILKNMDKK